jgi:hypothetical protein
MGHGIYLLDLVFVSNLGLAVRLTEQNGMFFVSGRTHRCAPTEHLKKKRYDPNEKSG